MKERIGFIGLGLMGTGMATNLVRKGWPLTIMAHRKREGVEALLKLGASEAATPKAVAAASDIVVLCVTGSPQVEALINGPDGLAAAGKALMIIDCSTSNPAVTTRLAEELKAQNITLVDAPMSRTPKDAMEGNLDIMSGGSEEEFARARQVLDAFAGRVTHTGPVGSGHTMKLLNNFISLGYAALYSEALMLGVKAGLAPKTFDSVIRGGRMDCGFYQTFFKYVLERDRNAHQFTLGAANPMGAAVRNAFATAVGTGQGEKYVPMLSDIVAELNGVSITNV
jgi:3-hydroxyisobutyrate dehydrogenase-like beta-hydroxyacid dehydrogenase